MIQDEEIIEILKSKNLQIPKFREESILNKALWILQISKDNTPASLLSTKAISRIAHDILDEDINKDSISKAFSRAGKKVKRGGGFYEIMGPGRKELKEASEEETEKIYDKGSRFDFHLDIKEIIQKAQKELFIVDSYINEDLLEIYLKAVVGKRIDIKILTNSEHPKGNFIKISNMFAKQHKGKGKFEAREIDCVHDRAIFIDNREGWVMGQSVKDAAKNKPTYLIKLKNPQKLEDIHNKIWLTSKKIR